MSLASVEAGAELRPVTVYFPGRSKRWVADTCRGGRIPGALKIGNVWMIRAADFERLQSGPAKARPRPPTVDEAREDLRRRGIA